MKRRSLPLFLLLASSATWIGCTPSANSGATSRPSGQATAEEPEAKTSESVVGAKMSPALKRNGELVGPQRWEGEAVVWDIPSEWKQFNESGVRVASLYPNSSVPLEVAVTRFPGGVGGPLANVNRWRQQIGLTELAQEELSDHVTQFTLGDVKGALIDMVGEGEHPLRVIVISLPIMNGTWFFKTLGPAGAVEEQRDTFLRFVSSVQLR
jgi:hypothetical protein